MTAEWWIVLLLAIGGFRVLSLLNGIRRDLGGIDQRLRGIFETLIEVQVEQKGIGTDVSAAASDTNELRARLAPTLKPWDEAVSADDINT